MFSNGKAKRYRVFWLAAGLLLFSLLALTVEQGNLQQYFELWKIRVQEVLDPPGVMPTPISFSPPVVSSEEVVPQEIIPPEATPVSDKLQLPEQYALPQPAFEGQDWNNCGPAALAILLHSFEWQGDQTTISRVIKPLQEDKNVNIEELAGYVNENVPDRQAIFRVGGNMFLLQSLIAKDFPVLIETGFWMPEGSAGLRGADDDRWTGHYIVVTGYDDTVEEFIVQDPFYGPDQRMSYTELDDLWQMFNRMYLVVYKSDDLNQIPEIVGNNINLNFNRNQALQTAQLEARLHPENAFAWFNVGSNLVYLEQYSDAALAYDKARRLGLPQRMLRYQFGPFQAYYHTKRFEELQALVEYALRITSNSEEALLWQGWLYYEQGQKSSARIAFQQAIEAHPGFSDAITAITFVNEN